MVRLVKVAVTCFGAMREYLPSHALDNCAELELDAGATVGDVIDRLGAPRRLVYSVLVDGERADLDQPLRDRSEVTLMPPFTGGCIYARS